MYVEPGDKEGGGGNLCETKRFQACAACVACVACVAWVVSVESDFASTVADIIL